MKFHDVLYWYLYESTFEERKSLAAINNRIVGLEPPESEGGPNVNEAVSALPLDKTTGKPYWKRTLQSTVPPGEYEAHILTTTLTKGKNQHRKPYLKQTVALKEMRDENQYSTLEVDVYEPQSATSKKWWKHFTSTKNWLTASNIVAGAKVSDATTVSNALGGLYKRGLVERRQSAGTTKRTFEYRLK